MIHNLDPVLIDFGMFEIRWYSLAYIFGILAGWWYGKIIINKFTKHPDRQKYAKNFDDLISYIIIGVIIGGRLGYVLFYDPIFFLENKAEIFKIWKGGMSFHGGLIGVVLSTYIFSSFKNLNYKIYFDTLSCVAPIGIFFGRIANFINGELYGVPTEKPWGIIFPKIDNLARHPSQIYEALLEGIALFFILNFIIRKKKFNHGFVSSIFLILYGIFRIASEQFREPDQHIGYILGNYSMGSLLSFLMIIFSLIFLFKIFKHEKNK